MQKIILDTNVLISALISKGIPSDIVESLILENLVTTCLSGEVLNEYIEVINRKKFSTIKNFLTNAEQLIYQIEHFSILYSPKIKLEILFDKSDNKFLELAVASEADYLITGNTNDFTIKKIGTTKIVSPRIYWENYKPE